MDTPLINYLDDSQMLTGSDYSASLFPMHGEWGEIREPVTQPKSIPELDPSVSINTTPASPLLNSSHPFQFSSPPQPSNISSVVTMAPASGRKVSATDIRMGVTPATLLDESAPTELRNYLTPSEISMRQEVPAVFSRKRAWSTAFGDEEDRLDQEDQCDQEDQLEEEDQFDEEDQIEQNHRQNTFARGRKRRLEHLELLKSLEMERLEKEQWRETVFLLSSFISGLVELL